MKNEEKKVMFWMLQFTLMFAQFPASLTWKLWEEQRVDLSLNSDVF